jgi:serine protease Do
MRQPFNTKFCPALFLSLLICLISFQHSFGQKISAVENYALNRPGIVMIRTVFSADVYINKMKMDSRQFNNLLDSIQHLENSGVIFSAEQKLDIVLKEMYNNSGRYFKATMDYIRQGEQITSTGTGFFLTGDGYVATNCHLIDLENNFIRRQFILSAFRQITEDNLDALQNSWATTFTEQQRSLLDNTYASVYSRLFSMVLNNLKKEVYVVYRYDRGIHAPASESKAADIVIKGLPMPGKDIAILKIDGDSSLPTLRIAGKQLPQVGEQLYVYGYPGPATNNDFVSAESSLEPTLTTGIVSAIKKSVGGWPVIQMDANINHGSSGGPVCNERGEVIGLTTFGSLENRGGLAAGLNFAIPVSILHEYLDSADVEPRISHTSQVFGQGIHYFQQEFYRKALKKFEEAKQLNGFYPGLSDYIAKCKSLVSSGEDKEAAVFRVDLFAFFLLFLLVISLYVLLNRRKKHLPPGFPGSTRRGPGIS